MQFERQQRSGVVYKGRAIGDMYADIVEENAVIAELKSVQSLHQIHLAQLNDLHEAHESQEGTAH